MSIAFPLINGVRYDYSSIEIVAEGKRYPGIKAINYKDSLKPGHARGTSARITGRTRGTVENSGDFEMYKGFVEEFLAALVSKGGGTLGYGEVEFLVVCSYQARGMPLVTDELIGCRITDLEDGHQEGEEPLTVKATLDVLRVKRNGLEIVGEGL